MTADRAALVEKVAELFRTIYVTENDRRYAATVAIDLIRAEVLEEAAEAVKRELFTKSCCCSFEAEAAIRALHNGLEKEK